MRLLIFAVLCIFTWENCRPIPDWDKRKFNKYSPKARTLSRGDVPVEILIYREVTSEVGVQYILNTYPKLRRKPLEVWIKGMGLSKKDALQCIKFKTWLSISSG